MGNAKPLIVRIREFFGSKPGQTPQEFLAEFKALTGADRDWFVEQFNLMGLPTTASLQHAAAAA